VVPSSDDFARTMIELVTPFVLLKQAHARPKLLRDGDAVPADAAAVVVPGFALTPAGREAVGRYLEAGGTVYQSWARDFSDAVHLTGKETSVSPTKAWATARLGTLSGEQELRVPDMAVRDVEAGQGASDLARLVKGTEDPLEWSFGRPLFVEAPVGRGRYFYFAGRLEAALARAYDPWETDQSSRVYAALLPEAAVALDDPQVELFHKTRGAEEIVGVVSHCARARDVALRTRRPSRFADYFSGERAGEGETLSLRLGPADVRVLRVEPAREH
jgi:hypothetical protein